MADGSPAELAAMSKYHNAVTLKTHHAGRDSLLNELRKLQGVSEVILHPAKNESPSVFQIIPEKGQVVIHEVARLLEKKKIAVEEIFTEHGRVEEVFRQVTQGAS